MLYGYSKRHDRAAVDQLLAGYRGYLGPPRTASTITVQGGRHHRGRFEAGRPPIGRGGRLAWT